MHLSQRHMPLHSNWGSHRCHSDVQFCLGDSARGVLNTLAESFPVPLPFGPQDDELCRNSTTLGAHLCTPKDLLYYYRVSLLFSLGHSLLSSQYKGALWGLLHPSGVQQACAPEPDERLHSYQLNTLRGWLACRAKLALRRLFHSVQLSGGGICLSAYFASHEQPAVGSRASM